MPTGEREKLYKIVSKVHRLGSKLRFWATPDQPGHAREAVWRELLEADVDLIGTDDLPGLHDFLEKYKRGAFLR